LFIRARTLHLIENELVVLLNRLNDLSELTHRFAAYVRVLPSGVEESLIIPRLGDIKRCLDFARHDRFRLAVAGN